uniref:Polyadenylate-binding protein n=1 Tax=Lygus hesperus TaxID=30085 RepID=A0A0A9YKB8_LYGHE
MAGMNPMGGVPPMGFMGPQLFNNMNMPFMNPRMPMMPMPGMNAPMRPMGPNPMNQMRAARPMPQKPPMQPMMPMQHHMPPQPPQPQSQNLAALLTTLTPEQQKNVLGERLYNYIVRSHPSVAAKITGMLLEMDNAEILNMLDSHAILDGKIAEAQDVLSRHMNV